MENPTIPITMQVDSAPKTDVGRKRGNNEDWVAGFEPADSKEEMESGHLYIVADGVGGASKGEAASKYAAQNVLYQYYQHPEIPPAERLKAIIRKTCRDIYEFSIEKNSTRMATTLVAAVVRENRLTVANVGDSRAYLIRAGQVKQITRDHNLAAEMVRNGSMTEEEARVSKIKNTISRSLGGEPDVAVDIFEENLQAGDLILLCSDGLHFYTQKEDLLRFTSSGSPEEIARKLVDYANQSGGKDNISLYLVKILKPGEKASKPIDGHAPEKVDLDQLQTDYDRPTVIRKRRDRTRERSLLFIGGLMAVILIAGLTIGGYSLFAERNTGTPTLGISPVETGTSAQSDVPIVTASPTPPPVVQPIVTVVVVPPVTVPPTNTPRLDIGTIFTGTPSLTPTRDPGKTCVYQMQKDDWIWKVFDYYIPEPVPEKANTFYTYISCDFAANTCTGPRIYIVDVTLIQINDFLEIPGIDQTNCLSIENYSHWVTIINP